MNTKQKILDALDIAIDDLSEDRLIDILLDAYKDTRRQLNEVKFENARERETIRRERERMQEDHRRMREDPLYCAQGEYYFVYDKRMFGVRIQGRKIDMFERRPGVGHGVDVMAQPVPRLEL